MVDIAKGYYAALKEAGAFAMSSGGGLTLSDTSLLAGY